MAAYVDLNGLRTFRTKQNEYNLEHFASLSGGKVTAEQLPSYVDDVVEGYITKNAETGAITFYSDAEKTQVITGERGKIYVDLAATVDGTYRYSGSNYVAIGASVSTADKAVNDANGNPIITTYATKDELSTASSIAATKNSLGVVQVGDNFICFCPNCKVVVKQFYAVAFSFLPFPNLDGLFQIVPALYHSDNYAFSSLTTF